MEGIIKEMNRNITRIISTVLIASMLSACGMENPKETSSAASSSEVSTSTQSSTETSEPSTQEVQTTATTTCEDSSSTETEVSTSSCVAATSETDAAGLADQTGSKTIKPIPQLYNPQNFSNGTAYAAIVPSTIIVNGDGTLTIQAEIYELIRYAANDVENLKPGDDFDGMKVETIEIDKWGARINGGGPENGDGDETGLDLSKSKDGTYTWSGIDAEMHTYDDGLVTLTTAPDFQYSYADYIDTGETYTYGASEFATLLSQGKLDCLTESCFTQITVKNGLLTSIAYTAAV